MRLRCSDIRIDCTADSFQLGHIDGIRILRASCDIGNLTGNVLRSIAHRNCSSCRFPNATCIFIAVSSRRIITNCILINRSYRTCTKGHTAIYLSIGIMTDDDRIFI